jgi:putative protease
MEGSHDPVIEPLLPWITFPCTIPLMSPSRPVTPEILAPVGNWEMLRAAAHNGADAVYMGMPGFNARGRAPTLEVDELRAMIEYAHLYGVKVFLAFNILIFERELSDVIEALHEVIPLHPDAFIVQDLGIAALIRHMAPDQAVHASTQMTVTNAEAIKLTEDLKMERYVLGREVSILEMAKIKAATDKELEVFVHGALCVSYSGQCLTSESVGGRSANRGQCAQSCRLPYDLIVDGERRELGEKRYLVSPQDLCGLEDVPRLVELGIESFKIEGRLKSPEYVATTSRAYKERSLGHLSASQTDENIDQMARVYSRGFFNGWFDGVNHQKLVPAQVSSHHGLTLGEVVAVNRDSIVVDSDVRVEGGDGVVFVDHSTKEQIGGTVYQAHSEKRGTRLSFSRAFPLAKVTTTMCAYLNSSPHLEGAVRKTFSDKDLLKKIPVSLSVSGKVGEALAVTATDSDGNTAHAHSTSVLQQATRAPLTAESLSAELAALGGTVFTLASLTSEVEGDCFLHSRELKEIRRSLCARLEQQRLTRPNKAMLSKETTQTWIEKHSVHSPGRSQPSLNVLVREMSQLDGLRNLPISTVFLDFEFGKEYGAAAEMVRAMGYKVGIATTRILKPGELAHLKVIERIKPDEVLVRNLGALEYLRNKGLTLIGDFSFNVTNSLSAHYLLSKGLSRICPSYDLNGEQLMDLARVCDASSFEVTVHHYIPAFHMEHCVFAAFLSNGSSYRDCGRPCEKHRVELRDSKGALHPLKADAECRNTMFNGLPQSAGRLIPQLQDLSVSTFRVDGLFEDPATLRAKIEAYADVLFHGAPVEAAMKKLGMSDRYGVTDGQLYNVRKHRDRKQAFTNLATLSDSADPGIKRILMSGN